MAEEWRIITEFPDYEISDLGNVRRGGRQRKLCLNPSTGYSQVLISHNSRKYMRYPHRLVAQYFIGIPEKMTVNHKNGVKTDNRLVNIEVMTLSENMRHSYRVLGRNADVAERNIRDPQTGRILGTRKRKVA